MRKISHKICRIAEFMREYKLVKEFGEGVDRMFREMVEAGNPASEYKQVEFMVKVKPTSALRDEDETNEKTGEKAYPEKCPEKRKVARKMARKVARKCPESIRCSIL